MIFTLARLVTACEDYLLTQEVDTACQNITETLAWYLSRAIFVKDTVPDEINGRHTAYERYKGLTVLAHHHPKLLLVNLMITGVPGRFTGLGQLRPLCTNGNW